MKTLNRYAVALLLCTGLACAVELTTLSAALRTGLRPTALAIMLGAFHLGYLAADLVGKIVKAHARGSWLVFVATTVCTFALMHLDEEWSISIIAVSLFTFNCVMQAYRRSLKGISSVDSRIKNTTKALGMVLGGALGSSNFTMIALIVIALALAVTAPRLMLPGAEHADLGALNVRDRLLLIGEFFHHAHYFAYCYTFWYLAPSLISIWTGVWFLLGWVGYFVTERLWRERHRRFSRAVIAAGHLVAAAALLALPHMAPVGVLTAWFVTGVGGGTAYMLGNAGHRGPREQYEDAGHVGGAIIAATVAALASSDRSGAELTTVAGACLAVLTAMIFVVVPEKARDQPIYPKVEESKCA